jgi:CRP-like cAMP-binding protein
MTYPVTAEAVGDCQALFWDQDTIRRLMDRYPRIALNALHIMSGQIRLFQNRVRELSTQRVEQRIARTILRLTEQTSRPMRDGLLIDLPLSREDLAQMTGSTLYTVSRVLTGWEKKGLVRCKRQEIIVKELHALHAIAENSPVVPPTTSQTDKLCDV